MKTFSKVAIFALMALVFLPVTTQAQNVGDFNMEWVKFESGQGPITGGVALATRYKRDDGRFVEISTQSQAAWLILGQYIEKGDFTLALGATVGHQQDAFWAGPYIDASFQLTDEVKGGILYWPGVFQEEPTGWNTRDDGVENPESIFLGNFGGVYLDLGPVSLSYYMLDFMDDPVNTLPGTSITFPIGEEMKISFSATQNSNAETWMWLFGGKWSPNSG